MKEPGRHLEGFSTGIAPDQAERLAMAAEECAEVVAIIMKAQRHGLGSVHPADPSRTLNKELIRQEFIDVLAMFGVLFQNGDIDDVSAEEVARRIKAKKRYTHFQGPETVW